ncbi:MAG: AmfC protein [Acidimicrobiales bacterium]
MLRAELDHVLAPEFLGDLSERPLPEVRALRDECTAVEQKVSYLRRLVHGRIDIVVGELGRRAAGGDPTDLGGLVEGLRDVLAENVHAPGHARMVTRVAPPDVDEVTAELDAALGPRSLASLPDLSDDEVRALADGLAALDREYSERRRALFDRLEVLGAELTRRYGTGEATVDSVLR